MKVLIILLIALSPLLSNAKEIALTFDDAPMPDSGHFRSMARTEELIRNLKELNVPSVMVFANPCKGDDVAATIKQLKKYSDAGHFIGNHTCSHPRLDDVGFLQYSKDAEKADSLLSPLLVGQKFFRYPYLNESKDEKLRDDMRKWLIKNDYRNGMVSIDNDDYIFSFKINQAKERGNKVDYKKVEKLFIEHLVGAANFYENLAIKTIGYSPKHVILLHEMDATVMFIEPLVNELRKQGWKIIGIDEAFRDKLYLQQPKNIYANNGIIAQVAMEKTGERIGYNHFDTIKAELNSILGIE